MGLVNRTLAAGLGVWGLLLIALSVAQPQSRVPMTIDPDESPIEEQPGVVPDPEDERLSPIYQRQLVFFRTAEPPGTIVISTSIIVLP